MKQAFLLDAFVLFFVFYEGNARNKDVCHLSELIEAVLLLVQGIPSPSPSPSPSWAGDPAVPRLQF